MKKNFFRFLFSFFTLVLIMSVSSKSSAELTSTFDVVNFKPAVDSTRFITLYDAQNHKKGDWNIGFYLDWAHHPLELASPVGTRRAGVVDDTAVMDVIGSYGFTDWFTAGARVPVVLFNNYKGLSNTVVRSLAEHDFSMGDVSVDLKFRLFESEHLGLGIIPFVNIPTGRSTTFMGQGTVTGGAKLAFHVDPHERVRVGLNAGYLAKDGVTIRGAHIDDMVTLGLGLNVKAHSKIDVVAEVHTESVASNLFKSRVQTPLEALGAVRIHATKGIDVTVGGGSGFTNGVGSPDFRAFLGLNYTHRKEEAAPVIKPSKIVIDQKIHFDFDKSTIKSESYAILDDVASVLKSHPGIRLVRVEGHTDSTGSDSYNMRLSQRRADAVRNYLVNKGIESSRLESVGYGESRPIADNGTASGRAMNRRTEFNVVER